MRSLFSQFLPFLKLQCEYKFLRSDHTLLGCPFLHFWTTQNTWNTRKPTKGQDTFVRNKTSCVLNQMMRVPLPLNVSETTSRSHHMMQVPVYHENFGYSKTFTGNLKPAAPQSKYCLLETAQLSETKTKPGNPIHFLVILEENTYPKKFKQITTT